MANEGKTTKNMKHKSAVRLSEERISLLRFSDDDIDSGRLIPRAVLDKKDQEWLSEQQKNELDKRLNDYQNGIGKNYTWDETVSMSKRALAERKNKRK
jgi:hypothetical protein